jgi:hypothetical protein
MTERAPDPLDLDLDYAEMVSDAEREAEALAWIEGGRSRRRGGPRRRGNHSVTAYAMLPVTE